MRRGGIIALLIFQSLWLNVIIPGHTRGAITLPGFKPAAAAKHACCTPTGGDSKKSTPCDDRASHCAVCFFAARLSMPVVIDLTPQPLALCGERERPAREIVASLDLQLAYLGRAPPASS